MARTYTLEQVREKAAVDKLRPQWDWVKGKPGYKEWYDKSGKLQRRYRFETNKHGKLTKQGHEALEMTKAWCRADAERMAKVRLTQETAELRDKNGNLHSVDAALADSTAVRNGWSHSWRLRGGSVERGVDGMLWRKTPDGWEPLGVTCLGKPLRGSPRVRCRGLQHDPEGHPWRGLGRRGWVRL